MARITHICGHEQDHYLIGEYAADCDRQAARLARQKCRSCSEVATTLAHCEREAAIAGLTLAALEGSAKQVAWAETIRAKRLAALQRTHKAAAESMAHVSDARWWIEQRSVPDSALITLLGNDTSPAIGR